MKNAIHAALLAALLCMTVGCGGHQIVPLPPLQASPDYVIQPGDTLEFLLFNPGQSQGSGAEPIKLTVEPGGRVMIPYVGAVQAAGSSPRNLLEFVRGKFSKIFTTPTVPHLSVQVFPSRTVHILGFVRNPNRFEWRHGMRVTDAVALAGGIQHPFAQPNDSVLLRRVTPGDRYENYQVRLTDITYGEDTTTNAVLEPGDIIFVPATGFRRIAFFIEDLLAPFQALFTPIVGPASAIATGGGGGA